MGSDDLYLKKKKFIEEVSLAFEESGKPRIFGLIFGWLMICTPPEQSFSDLVEHLEVSKASISNMSRMLLQAGLIEKTRMPGEREIYFRIKNEAYRDVLRSELKLLFALRSISAKGLDLIDEEPDADDGRLREMHNFYTFASESLTKMLDEYEAQQSAG